MKTIKYILYLAVFVKINVQAQQTKLSLKEAITFAIEHNFTQRLVEKDVGVVKAKKWETIATGLPSVDGKLDYRKWLKQVVQLIPSQMAGMPPGGFVPVTFGTEQTMEASMTLKQLIFSGAYIVALQSSKTYLAISKLAVEKSKYEIRNAVVNAYGNVLVADQSIEILQRNKENLEQTLKDTRAIYKNGFTELESVEQLEITLGTLDNNLRNAKRMRLIASQMLNIALGNISNDEVLLTDTLDGLANVQDFNLLNKVFDINASVDYKMAVNNVKVKKQLLNLEKSKYLPTLSGYLNLATNSNSNTFTFFDKDQKWFNSSLVGMSLNIPLFSSFKRAAKMSQARIEFEKTQVQLQEIKQKLTLQAQVAKSEYQLSLEALITAKKNLNLSERIEKKNQVKFKEGISSSFDLFQAQRQLYSLQNNYIQAMLTVIQKRASLEAVLNTSIK